MIGYFIRFSFSAPRLLAGHLYRASFPASLRLGQLAYMRLVPVPLESTRRTGDFSSIRFYFFLVSYSLSLLYPVISILYKVCDKKLNFNVNRGSLLYARMRRAKNLSRATDL